MKIKGQGGVLHGRGGFLRLQRKRRLTALDEKDYLRAWVLFVFCATTVGFVSGVITGSIAGAILKAFGKSATFIQVASSIVGFCSGLPFSYMFFRMFVIRYLIEKLLSPSSHSEPAGVHSS